MKRRVLGLVLVALFAVCAVAVAATHKHSRVHVGASGSDPVFLGSQTVQQVQDGGKGTTEAFGYTATVTGTATNENVYLVSTGGVQLGLYADSNGKPGALLDHGSVASNVKGWISVPLAAGVQITAGTRYWLAISAKNSTTTVTYVDSGSGGSNLDYSGSGLTNPYKTTAQWRSNPASVYLGGTTGTTSSSSSSSSSTTTSSTSTQTTTSSQTTSTTSSSTTTASGPGCAGASGSKTPDYAALDACGYPSPNTTGVPAGTTLTPIAQASLPAGASWSSQNQELDVSGNNITLTNLNIQGAVHITGVNDQINDSFIGGNGNPEVLVYNGASNTTMSHDEITAPTSTIGAVNNADGTPFTMDHSYLHNNCTGVLGAGLNLHDNYMITDGNVPGCHVEDIYISPDTDNVDIDHNTLLNPLDQTAAVFLDDHAGGGCGNKGVTINNNILAGGDYPTYGDNGSDCSSGIVITNNRFSRLYFPNGGEFGADAENVAATTWSGNIWDDTLAPVAEEAG